MKYLLLFLSVGCLAQQTKKVDFKTLDAIVSADYASRKVAGHCEYSFEVLSSVDTISIDAVNMAFSNVKINKKSVASVTSAKALKLFKGFKKGKNKVSFDYSATPKQTMYFTGDATNYQIWTQGQGKNTSHWLPSFDDVNEKVVFSLSIRTDKDYVAISNGKLEKKSDKESKTTWEYSMQKPMSSYLVMAAIGKLSKRKELSASGIPLEMYFRPEDESKFESTYRHSKAIFDFFEREIGVKYPWEVYKQVPAFDFLYAGMENTSATIFSQDYVADDTAFNDRNYVTVNGHELAHQWFGDMVTAKSGKHHWLQEGFATYYSLLAEKEVFGTDHFNWKLYEMAEDLKQASATDTIPILNEKASSLTYYKKGAWALHVLRSAIGEDNFRKAVKSYLGKHAFRNVDTDDFLAEVRKVTSYDIDDFKKRWLESPGFESQEAIALLKQNGAMTAYFEVLELGATPYLEKKDRLMQLLKSDAFWPIKEEAVFQTEKIPFEEKLEFVRAALATGDLKVRQAVARTIGKFPETFYPEYISLLDDKSYITQEIVIGTVWPLFPDKHRELLDRTSSTVGFNDKNLRIQWLTLALVEKGYQPEKKVTFYDELLDYTTEKYEAVVRQNALENLIYIGPGDMNVLERLVPPLVHHRWQFSKFAREKIRELIKYPAPRKFYNEMLPKLPQDQKAQLQRLLDEKAL